MAQVDTCASRGIMAEKYRNRRKRFTLRLNLIAGIINYEL
jgi:hypothetical protein